MRVLVTGGNGFVGSRVARLCCQRGDDTVALVRHPERAERLRDLGGPIRVVAGDLDDHAATAEIVRNARPDLCIHAAWYAVPGKYLHAAENFECVAGTMALARALVAAGCKRLVALGTCFEYDTNCGWLSESTPTRPGHPYSAAKLATALMLEQLGRTSSMTVAWARLFYLYGPGEDERRLVPAVIRALLEGEPALVTSGNQVRDYLHVDEVASALLAVSTSQLSGMVNIGSGQPVTVRTMVETVASAIGRPDLPRFGARPDDPSDPPFICANTANLRAATDWRPKLDLQTGITETIDWWRGKLADPSRPPVLPPA